jgi:hypothetical protein
MATQVQIRRGTSSQVAAFTGAEGEIVVNTTNDSVHVNDGSTAGGFELARVDGSNWAITNAITTTGTLTAASLVVDTTTLVVDATNNNVGIGTSSPVNSANRNTLAIQGAWGGQLDIMVGSTVHAQFGTDNFSSGQSCRIQSQDGIVFKPAGAQRMIIDSGGNVGIGNSGVASTRLAVTNSVVGANIETTSSDAGHEGLIVNRQNSDGTAIAINRAGSTVGSIGASGGTIYAGKGGSGLIFNDGGTKDLIPYSLTASDTVDNSISLGIGSKRFKALYLSGGAYLGGTGSTNYLDDYEQGSWSSTTAGITGATVTAARYTKIGQLVSCDLRATWTGSTNDSTVLSFSLPFLASSPGGASRTGIVFYQGTSLLGGYAISSHISVGGSTVAFYGAGGGTFRSIIASDINGSYDWLVSFSYFTDL